eukprot:UN18103
MYQETTMSRCPSKEIVLKLVVSNSDGDETDILAASSHNPSPKIQQALLDMEQTKNHRFRQSREEGSAAKHEDFYHDLSTVHKRNDTYEAEIFTTPMEYV